MSVVLENETLRVTINPHVGGTITKIVHRASGLSVLGTTPWHFSDPDSGALPRRFYRGRTD